METVDFTEEINKIKEKIKLLNDVKNAIDNESKTKQSVEMLESLYNRANDLEVAENNCN